MTETQPVVAALCLGQPQTHTYFGKPVETGGGKHPVPAAHLGRLGFEGDGQADLVNHGGPDKAACVYGLDHYPYWERWLGRPLAPGAFSENLTLTGLAETGVAIGDEFQIGLPGVGPRVQVSQPRVPCGKLAGKHGRKDLPEHIHLTGFSGFYVRVLAEGRVQTGDALTRVAEDPARVTIAFVNDLYYRRRTAPDDFERALAVAALSDAARASLLKRRAALGQ